MPKTNTVEFEKDDVKLIETMQKDYVSLQTAIGTIYLRKHQAIQQLEQIENQLSELEVNFTRLREDEKTLMKNLEEKYGQGGLDLETGEFTPNK